MISEKAKESKKIAKQKKGLIKAQSDFFRKARYGLTRQQHRIVYAVILKGQLQGTPFVPVTMSIAEFKELCEINYDAIYTELRKASEKLVRQSVEIFYFDDKGGHLLQANWMSSVEYHAKNGTITLTPNKLLEKFFSNKPPYTTTEFYFLVKFRCQYSERLYELLKSTASPKKPLIDFTVEDLRERLAIPKTKYPNYAHLKQFVLTPALDDINKFTDLDVDKREDHGMYNKVERVNFSVHAKKDYIPLAERVQKGLISDSIPDDLPAEGQLSFLDKLGINLPQEESDEQ